MRWGLVLALLLSFPAVAAEFTAAPAPVADEKAVFATVESRNVVPARARTGGTVAKLSVRRGDSVAPGQVIAVVTDPKLMLQTTALDAQIVGLQSQMAQAQADLARAQELSRSGAVSRQALDQAETAARVSAASLQAEIAQRGVVRQQIEEGAVLAPVGGRVLDVPVTEGSVVMPGDPLASLAERDYVLRLAMPERHAAFLRAGDPVRLEGDEAGAGAPRFGTITLVYPQIQDGRVRVEATAPGLGEYFVGQRIRVWVSAGTRQAVVVPAGFLGTRYGLDYARVKATPGVVQEVPVQRGRPAPTPAMPDGIEILSGLRAGDVLVSP